MWSKVQVRKYKILVCSEYRKIQIKWPQCVQPVVLCDAISNYNDFTIVKCTYTCLPAGRPIICQKSLFFEYYILPTSILVGPRSS